MSIAVGGPLPSKVLDRRARNKMFWSYGAVVTFVLLTAVAVVGHAGAILNYAFPLMAASLAGALFIYRRSTYFAFVWWIWLASPEVRRLVDFQTGYHNISPVMVSPLLVTGFALLAVIQRPQVLLRRSMLPFTLIALVTFFAFFIGALTNGFFASAYEWASWLEPLSFCVFLLMDNRALQENRVALLGAIVTGLVFVGAYGIYQFFHFPPWDAYWLTNSKLSSAGSAFAEQVRVFGPLNDPGVFAFVLTASLVFMLVAKGPMKIVAGAAGFPALALSQVRAAWGAWVVAAIFVFWRVGGKSRIRIAVASVVIVGIAVPILTVGPVGTLLTNRFATVSNIQQDHSAQAREELYESFIATSLSQPIGNGFGALGVAAKLVSGQNVDFDSGFLELPFTFGWVGGLVFVWAIFKISFSMLAVYLKSKTPVTTAACGLFFGMMAALIFGQVFAGALGMIVWTTVGLALSSPIHQGRKVGPRQI